ncbi:hypothetical protein V5799_018292, partial [Amblyomma americanum]
PLWGLLTKFLSLRTQTLLGSFIVAASSILCYFARSLTAVIILQGICGGIGQGIVMPTKDLLIGYHFRRYRASAIGIYFIGGTLAAFIYPMLLLLLVQEYNLGGALLITGGLQLHGLAGSLFYRKPPWTQAQNEMEARRNSSGRKGSAASKDSPGREALKSVKCAGRDTICANDNGHVSESRDGDRIKEVQSGAAVADAGAAVADVSKENRQQNEDAFKNGATHGKHELNGSPASATADAAPLLSSSKGAANEVEKAAVQMNVTRKGSRLANSRDFSFLRYPVFYMILVTCSFSAFSMMTFTILVDYVKEKGFTAQNGAILLSVRAIGDAISRPLSGLLSDRNLVDRRTLMCASKLTVACVCAMVPFVESYAALLVLVVFLGWGTGTAVVLFVPIMADQVGVRSIGLSMGFCRLAMGVGHLVCPIIIGHFKDQLGSYEGIFYLSSTVSLLVGSIWLAEAIRITVHRRRRRRASTTVRWASVPTSDQQSTTAPS